MEELWKPIKDYPNYEISNFGRVKKINKNNFIIRKLSINNHGYYHVGLSKNGKTKTLDVHKLVAIHFLNHTPCKWKIVVNHKDFNRLNNHVDNLELITARENTNLKHKKHSSKYTGVSWHKSNCTWTAYIFINKKLKHLGSYNNEFDAHLAYQKALKEITVH
jgi:hypothetical protein